MDDELLTPQEVAKMLRVTPRSVARWAADGKLKGFKVGSDWRFKRAAIDDFIKASTPEPKVKKVEGLAVVSY